MTARNAFLSIFAALSGKEKTELLQMSRHYLLYLRAFLLTGERPCDKNVVITGTNAPSERHERRSDDAPASAAADGIAYLFARCYAEPDASPAVFYGVGHKSGIAAGDPARVCPVELAVFSERKIILLAARHGSVAELLPALGSAAREDLAAVGGGHPLAEAVLHLAMAFLGLICPFQISTLRSVKY